MLLIIDRIPFFLSHGFSLLSCLISSYIYDNSIRNEVKDKTQKCEGLVVRVGVAPTGPVKTKDLQSSPALYGTTSPGRQGFVYEAFSSVPESNQS